MKSLMNWILMISIFFMGMITQREFEFLSKEAPPSQSLAQETSLTTEEEWKQEISHGGQFEKDMSHFGKSIIFSILVTIAFGILMWKFIIPSLTEKFSSVVYGGMGVHQLSDLEKARHFVAHERYEQALKLYKKLIQEQNQDVTLWIEMARVYRFHKMNSKMAMELLSEAEVSVAGDEASVMKIMLAKADILKEDFDDIEAAHAILNDIQASYPNTYESRLAKQKQEDWSTQDML
jgi:tetratricopeptide (TPR) repeat protein